MVGVDAKALWPKVGGFRFRLIVGGLKKEHVYRPYEDDVRKALCSSSDREFRTIDWNAAEFGRHLDRDKIERVMFGQRMSCLFYAINMMKKNRILMRCDIDE